MILLDFHIPIESGSFESFSNETLLNVYTFQLLQMKYDRKTTANNLSKNVKLAEINEWSLTEITKYIVVMKVVKVKVWYE